MGHIRFTVAVAVAAALVTAVPVVSADAGSVANRPDHGLLVSAERITNLDESLTAVGAQASRIRYRSRALDGRDITVSGALLVPSGKAPRGGWPVVGWAHGTSGIIDDCAPSTIHNANGKIDLYGYAPVILARFVSAGFAVAATDYEGLGTPGEHPFLIADSAGRSIIDAVHAARQAAPQLSRSWFAVGHSQGGHAAIAAGELAATWGRGLDFRGSVGIAPVTDVGAMYNYGSPGPNERGFYLLVLTGLQSLHPDLRLADYLGAQAQQMVPKIHQECMATMLPFFSQNFGDRLTDYQFTPQSPDAFQRPQPWLDAQSMPSRRAAGPLLLLQGDRDEFMKAHLTRQAVRNARAFGTSAEFRLYQGSDHISVLFDAGPDVLRWMSTHLRRG